MFLQMFYFTCNDGLIYQYVYYILLFGFSLHHQPQPMLAMMSRLSTSAVVTGKSVNAPRNSLHSRSSMVSLPGAG